MKLTLDALNVLDAIDQGGSFAAAAENLYRVPSAISYTMQKLEQDLGAPVFDRSGHRAVLTPAGKTLLKEGRRLLLAAHELENQVKRIATGWESELRIAMDTLIPAHNLLSLVAEFYNEHTSASTDDPAAQSVIQNVIQNKGTQLRLQQEVLGGTWDALVSNRTDLVIGATGDAPAGAGYSHFSLSECAMVFVVPPNHPLAMAEEPIGSTDILKYRAVAIADSSRYLPPRSSGLLTGQEVLTVPDMVSKLEAHIQGLGIGYLPLYWAQAAIDARQLLVKSVEATPNRAIQKIAWRSDNQGKALKWFVEKLRQPAVQQRLLRCH